MLVGPGDGLGDFRRLHRSGLGLLEGLAEGGLAPVDGVGAGHEHQGARAAERLLQRRVDGVGLEAAGLLVEQGQVLGRVGGNSLVVEGLGQVVGDIGRLARGGLRRGGLQQHAPLGDFAVELRLGDAILDDAALFGVDGRQGRFPLGRLGGEVELGHFGRVLVVALQGIGADEGRIVGPGDALQAPVQHLQAKLLDLLALALGLAVGGSVMRLQPFDLDA